MLWQSEHSPFSRRCCIWQASCVSAFYVSCLHRLWGHWHGHLVTGYDGALTDALSIICSGDGVPKGSLLAHMHVCSSVTWVAWARNAVWPCSRCRQSNFEEFWYRGICGAYVKTFLDIRLRPHFSGSIRDYLFPRHAFSFRSVACASNISYNPFVIRFRACSLLRLLCDPSYMYFCWRCKSLRLYVLMLDM